MRTELNEKESLLSQLSTKPPLIKRIESRLKKDNRLGINIGQEEGLLLKSLCSQDSVHKVVEIGTQYGCSAAWMAMGLAHGGKIYCFEKDPETAEQAQKTFQDSDFISTSCEVELFIGDASERLSSIEAQGPFDLIFIDANKAAYFDYFQWAKKNIRPGGLIIADNVYLFGTVFLDQCPEKTPKKMWIGMKKMLSDAFSDESLDSSIVPTEEGLLICTKKPV